MIFSKQRAKQFLLQGSDTNSKYFHNSVKARRRHNKIEKLKSLDDNWVTKENDLDSLIFYYFQNIYDSNVGNLSPALECIPYSITDAQNTTIMCKVGKEEVHEALLRMHPDKSLSPDGMSSEFYEIFLGYYRSKRCVSL